jgi:hypothetical protein
LVENHLDCYSPRIRPPRINLAGFRGFTTTRSSTASPQLSPYERPCRLEEEGIKSRTFGEHIVDKYRSSFLEKNSLISNEDYTPQENPCICSQHELDVYMMAYPRMLILRTHVHMWPPSKKPNSLVIFFLTATEQSKARTLLSLYFSRVLQLGGGGTTSCKRYGSCIIYLSLTLICSVVLWFHSVLHVVIGDFLGPICPLWFCSRIPVCFTMELFPHEEMRFHAFYFLLLLVNCEI